MFNYSFTINLYKSRINPSNYFEILTESLNHVVSLDLLNYSIEYLLEDGDLVVADKFLLLCVNNLKSNIRFYEVFIKSKYQDILKNPISYNMYNKFVQICQITEKEVTVKSDSFYNYVLYRRFSNNHHLDVKYEQENLSLVDFNIYRELIEEIYKYNIKDDEFVCHANKLGIRITEKNIKENFECMNFNSLKDLLISINTNPMDYHYEALKSFDLEDNENEQILVSFVKSLLQKDVYSFKKVYLIFENIKASKRLLFAYFVYLYLTYKKYTNVYLRDRILNIVTRTDFSDLMDMIIEYYISLHPPHEDLDSYFSSLSDFMDFNYNSYIHIIYPILYTNYDIQIQKYDHYIKVHHLLNRDDNGKKQEKVAKLNLNHKEIALCLLNGFYDFKPYKIMIKNNITHILNFIRQEYINKNITTCIFDILRYITEVLGIKISANVWEYFRALGCLNCKDNCLEIIRFNENDKLENCSKNVYKIFKDMLGNPKDDVELIRNFILKYETDLDFKQKLLSIYDKLPDSVLKITGLIIYNRNTDISSRNVICSDIVKYFKDNFIEELKMNNYELYSKAMDLLFYNAQIQISIKQITPSEIRKAKKYHKFLANMNDFLAAQLNSGDGSHEILKYTELFTTRILEFSIINMLPNSNINEIREIFTDILTDKINHKILKFIIEVNFVCNIGIDTDLIIETSKIVENYHYIIFLVEKKLSINKNEGLFDLLQESYYKIKDYDRVQGINSMFTRPSKANLYYEYKIDKEREDIDIDILDQCRVIEEDLSEWKNIKIKDDMGRHFMKDCELVEKDIQNLNLVSKRRHISGETKLLILHDLLYKGVMKTFKSECGPQLAYEIMTEEEDFYTANSFFIEMKRDHISQLIKDKKYEKSIELIYEMLEMKEWSFYYDLCEVYILLGNKSKAKECLKKILNIFSKEDSTYQKALLKYLELVNSQDLYAKNINSLKNSSRVWYLYGKISESIEFFMNSLLIDGEYKYECVPRIFHILSEAEDKKKLNKAFKLVSQLLDQTHLKNLLLPFFNQILCKINNNLLTKFINKIILSIMSDHREVYWSAIYFINDIETDSLEIDNKVYLNKIKKMRDILYSISKVQTISNLKKEFPDITSCIGMHIPNKFPIEIQDIENEVLIYRSLQAPKRLCFIGDDGKKYYYLCKYKDDLRKDSRFTEVCRLINKLFRGLDTPDYYIRTYEVIPCFYNFGLIEYIEGLVSIKTIVTKSYDNIGLIARKYSAKKKVGIKDFPSVLASFKPVMDSYLRSQVVDPFHWYKIRNNYVQTCGVINIVGWFMGLGDRHTENILLDSTTFDMVHVDLNCIFDKGKACSIPELVPFRLTQNIINGFGALGIHGTYTKACVSTLDLLQSNRSIIISNLLSFVYDPLHEWNKKESAAQKIVDTLSSKIENGDILSKVEELNDEATDPNNLCNMYIGWLSFI